jgi:hypothetical protein
MRCLFKCGATYFSFETGHVFLREFGIWREELCQETGERLAAHCGQLLKVVSEDLGIVWVQKSLKERFGLSERGLKSRWGGTNHQRERCLKGNSTFIGYV